MKGMTPIVKTVTRWVKAFIFLYGVYIVITGHLSPGGGFAGGVIIACSYMLLTLAYGGEFAFGRFGTKLAGHLDSSGALIFLAVALFGLGFGGVFFSNFLLTRYAAEEFTLLGSGTILISNVAIGLKVGASLFLVFAILSVLRLVASGEGGLTMIQDEEEE
jgi:multicomponent Na+:H+ antiporter subunit B